jgi:histidinol dehydrogenase
MRIVNGIEQGRALLTRRPGYDPSVPEVVQKRTDKIFGESLSSEEAVRRILSDVRKNGDDAVRDYGRRIDSVELTALEVPKEAWVASLKEIPSNILDALNIAAERIRSFNRASMPQGWRDAKTGLGETLVPLERVGLYVPGGTAAYPSTVLMGAIPAREAGVDEIILCTPAPEPVTLAAAHITGVDRLFQIGGAQAIGAMAYGTETVPRVDKICGPGNIFIAIAKREVYGQVDIDGLYGPTETVVIADDSADPILCAADLLAQAEHDVMASPVLLTTTEALAQQVNSEIEAQLAKMERKDIASQAVERQGLIVVIDTLDEALELANAYAPEHVCLLVRDPESLVSKVRHAGGIFLGEYSPEVIGDYVAGPSHTMPTGGTARFGSYLGVHQFLRRVPVVGLNESTFRKVGPAAAALGRAEGLTGHANAVDLRLEGQGTLPHGSKGG